MYNFSTPAPVRLRIAIPKGRIRMVAEAIATTTIELTAVGGDARAQAWIDSAEVVQEGDAVIVRVPWTRWGFFGLGGMFGGDGGIDAVIHAPLDSAATLSVGSGGIETSGRLGAINANSGSGDIRLEDGTEVRANTGSGDIEVRAAAGSVKAITGSGGVRIGEVAGHVQVTSGSGRIALAEAAGEARLLSASGDVEVERAGDSLVITAASGSIDIRRADHGRVRAKTHSGEVRVGVAGGTATRLDISTASGLVRSELQPGAAPAPGEKSLELVISTSSGNVNLARV